MATPLTAPPKEFFRQFANLAHNRVLNEDFPHEKLLTLKYKGTGSAFVVNAKGSLNVKSEVKKTEETTAEGNKVEVCQKVDTYPTSSEVKLLTGYNKTTTETRFNNKGIVKVHTNWGVHNVGEPVEVVSVVKGDTQFNKQKIWVGAYYAKGSVGSGTRVQLRRHKGLSFSLAQKLTYSHRDLWAGAYVDVNVSELKLTQYNAVVGYNVNKNIHFYAEHTTSNACCKPAPKKVETVSTVTEKNVVTEGANGPIAETTTVAVETKTQEVVPLLKRIGFGKGSLTGVYKDSKFWALATVGWEEPCETLTAEAGVVYTVNNNSSVRAKVNQDFNLAVGGRHKLNKNVSVNVGTNVPLKTPEKFYDSFKTVPIPFGCSLEFNF